MSSREFSEWMIFDRHEPVGARRLDWLAARIMALMANMMADRKKHPEAFKAGDFLPEFWQDTGDDEDAEDDEEQGMPWQTMLSIVEAMNKALGGKDLRKRPNATLQAGEGK